MSWSGGSYTKGNAATGGWAGDASLGIGIEAGRHDTQDNDFATGINNCLAKDGQNAMTANINLGGYVPTNVGAGTAAAPAYCAGNDSNTGMFSAAADNIGFATNGSERVRIDNTGKVGIGTTSPVTGLNSVSSDTFSGNANTVALFQATKTTTADAGIAIGSLNGNSPYIAATSLNNGAGTASTLRFRTAATDRLIIDASGNVGIGTNNPSANLHVSGVTNMYGNANGAYSAVVRNDNTGGAAYGLIVDGARNNYAFAVRDYLGNYRVVLNSDGTCGIGAVGGNNASISVGSGGTVLLQTGNTSRFQVDSSTGYKQFYNGSIYIDNTAISSAVGTNALRYNTSNGFVTYDTSSRLIKDNIVDSPYGLDAVLALQPRKYFRTDDQREEVGFVADEVEGVVPETVTYGPKSCFTKNEEDTEIIPVGVNYDRLTSVLCKAIQELNAKVEALEARIAVLEA